MLPNAIATTAILTSSSLTSHIHTCSHAQERLAHALGFLRDSKISIHPRRTRKHSVAWFRLELRVKTRRVATVIRNKRGIALFCANGSPLFLLCSVVLSLDLSLYFVSKFPPCRTIFSRALIRSIRAILPPPHVRAARPLLRHRLRELPEERRGPLPRRGMRLPPPPLARIMAKRQPHLGLPREEVLQRVRHVPYCRVVGRNNNWGA